MGVALACTGKSDCPQGDVCCGMLMGGRTGGSTCTAMCTGQQLCTGQADCAPGDRCIMTGTFGFCVGGLPDGGGFPRDAGFRD
jgi:hypothetical protein